MSPATGTRARLVDAAREEFLEHGYAGTTLRAVAKRAGVSLNLIHYHFDGKAALLADAVVQLMHAGHNVPARPDDAPDDPEDLLHAFIVRQVTHMLAQQSASIMQLVLHELQNPSPIIDKIVELGARPTVAALAKLVAAILPDGTRDDVVRRCCMTIIGQITHYKHGWPIISRVYPDLELDANEIDGIAQHIARFSLAGIRAERDRLLEEAS